MMRLHWSMSLLVLALAPAAALAQGARRDVIIHFKDNYVIHGKLHEKVKGGIFDPASGAYIPLLSGEFLLDDNIRSINFNPQQVLKVTNLKAGEVPISQYIQRQPFPDRNTTPIKPDWVLDRLGEWNEKGERSVYFKTPKGETRVLSQRIAFMTPKYAFAFTGGGYKWYPVYALQEYGPERTRDYMLHVYSEHKDLKGVKDAQKFLRIALFLQEAGFLKEAEKELDGIIQNYPDGKMKAEEQLVELRKARAELFVDSIEQARKVGQHQEALDRLDTYKELGYAKIVSPAYLDKARSLTQGYDQSKLALDEARRYLKMLAKTANKRDWTAAAKFITDELNHDTVERLDEFILQAKQYERQKKEKLALTHSVEQVLTFGVTSWLQGKDTFDKDPKVALKLLHARASLLKYLKGDGGLAGPAVAELRTGCDLPLDVLIKLIRYLPPAEALDASQLDPKVQTMNTANGGTYLLQLPPGYHHQRSYPVLMVCHSGRETADATMKRVSEEAAKQGVILVAPVWGGAGKKGLGGPKAVVGDSRHHKLALDTLRDLRRRLQIDSDRVFLLGWEAGANMAFDLGLAHPDQFAGVIPMNGTIQPFARRWYWTNAQNLPFYVVEGQANAGNVAAMNDLFKEWGRFPALYVEYRGRANEWFSAEVPAIFKWMSCQKRNTPLKQLGRNNLGVGLGEEFRSSRNSDTRFYWLSSAGIDLACQNDHAVLNPGPNYKPAMFQATLSAGNVLIKGAGQAKIWTRANVRTTGLRQVTLWITPGTEMIDLSNPIELIVNGQERGMKNVSPSLETLLEELHQSGDRQRLFVAKIEITIKI